MSPRHLRRESEPTCSRVSARADEEGDRIPNHGWYLMMSRAKRLSCQPQPLNLSRIRGETRRQALNAWRVVRGCIHTIKRKRYIGTYISTFCACFGRYLWSLAGERGGGGARRRRGASKTERKKGSTFTRNRVRWMLRSITEARSSVPRQRVSARSARSSARGPQIIGKTRERRKHRKNITEPLVAAACGGGLLPPSA